MFSGNQFRHDLDWWPCSTSSTIQVFVLRNAIWFRHLNFIHYCQVYAFNEQYLYWRSQKFNLHVKCGLLLLLLFRLQIIDCIQTKCTQGELNNHGPMWIFMNGVESHSPVSFGTCKWCLVARRDRWIQNMCPAVRVRLSIRLHVHILHAAGHNTKLCVASSPIVLLLRQMTPFASRSQRPIHLAHLCHPFRPCWCGMTATICRWACEYGSRNEFWWPKVIWHPEWWNRDLKLLPSRMPYSSLPQTHLTFKSVNVVAHSTLLTNAFRRLPHLISSTLH